MKASSRTIFLLVCSSTFSAAANAFCVSTTTTTTPCKTRTKTTNIIKTNLRAKKVRNNKKAKTNSNNHHNNRETGGFGIATAIASPKNSNKDDYVIFPALEPNVKATLVPASSSLSTTTTTATDNDDSVGPLSNEMYQRLDQIYGFPNFNHDKEISENDDDDNNNNNNEDTTSSSGSDAETILSMEDLISGNFQEEEEEDDDEGIPNKNPFSVIRKLPPFDKFRVLHVDPMVIEIRDFFTAEECDAYVAMAENESQNNNSNNMFQTGSMTVGKDSKSQSQRTSTTWFSHYKNVPELMAKASRLCGLDSIDRWEEPQTVRYRRNEKFTWHLDALGPDELTNTGGGQRVATLLVYHTDLNEHDGGGTCFRDLRDANGNRLKV